MYKHIVLLAVCCACVIQHSLCEQEEGDPCELPSVNGTCKKATECPEILEDLRKGLKPKICGFIGNTAVVCCRSPVTSQPTTKAPVSNDDDDYYDDIDASPVAECEPIPASATKVKKIGRKAWDKCIDYLQYVYTCEVSGALTLRPMKVRQVRCSHDIVHLLPYTYDTVDNEFPHMALLGFGPSESTVSWQCGGSVISENFVMTAAHCTYVRDLGSVTFVRVEIKRVSLPIDQRRLHRVAEIIKHPEYKPPSIYNDLALIKTATPINLDNRVYPACLHTGDTVNDNKMIATGWGFFNYQDNRSDTIQKVTLEKFTAEECKDFVPTSRKQVHGLLPASQICAGHHTKDICQGDSGGPLQIYNLDMRCMYTVVGVMSFRRRCGTIGEPSVHTRVSYYISWIESIVWP